MSKISALLIGIGGFGKFYIDECFDGESKNLIDIVGIVEPYPEACPRIEEIKQRKIPIFATIDEFYQKENAELAAIATPIGLHTEQIIKCLEHGSHVLCEKPLCADEADIQKIADAEKRTGKMLAVGYQWSTSKAVLDAKRDILNGTYGKPVLLKTLTLWPRDEKYFRRGTGWAGKIYSPDGKPIYDSIANNACAHYLHNMFFMLGKTNETSLAPDSVNAELLRANTIENFDTAVIRCKFGEASALFIASHTTRELVNPVFSYEFENGKLLLVSNDENAPEENKMPGFDNSEIVGFVNDGRVIRYGVPDNGGNCRKLALFARRIMGEKIDICGTDGAAVHTRVINLIQKNFKIKNACKTEVTDGLTVVPELGKALLKLYTSESSKSSASSDSLAGFYEKSEENFK